MKARPSFSSTNPFIDSVHQTDSRYANNNRDCSNPFLDNMELTLAALVKDCLDKQTQIHDTLM